MNEEIKECKPLLQSNPDLRNPDLQENSTLRDKSLLT